MRKFTAPCGALLLVSIMLITARYGATAVEEAVAVPAAAANMEIVAIGVKAPLKPQLTALPPTRFGGVCLTLGGLQSSALGTFGQVLLGL
jgi:hypothetical protein